MELLLLERLSLLLLQRFRFNGLFNTCERQFKQAVATRLRVTTTAFNPVTPMSDQERISPYNINQISDENINLGDN